MALQEKSASKHVYAVHAGMNERDDDKVRLRHRTNAHFPLRFDSVCGTGVIHSQALSCGEIECIWCRAKPR